MKTLNVAAEHLQAVNAMDQVALEAEEKVKQQ
jgi:hypothetical protein